MKTRPTNHDQLRMSESLRESPVPRVRGRGCRASLVVENGGPATALIRTATVRDVDGIRGEPGGTFDVRTPALVRPEERRRIPIRFRVPETTPPGSYRLEVSVAGFEQTMEVRVPPRSRLRVTPSVLVVGEPGTTTVHVLEVENAGNLPVSIGGSAAIPLEDERIECRALRGALTVADDLPEEEITVDRVLARAVVTAREALRGAILGVTVSADRDPVEPGGRAAVTVGIETPDALDRRTRYTALIPIATADVHVVVGPSRLARPAGEAGAEAEAQRPAPGATAKGTRRRTTRRTTRRADPKRGTGDAPG